MAQTYCGKNCDSCTYREELSCPGCHSGPGKKYYSECDLAKCCQQKSHETCETCQMKPHCGKLRGKDRMPERRIRERKLEAERQEAIAKRVPVLAKWMWPLFWLLIPQLIASLMLQENLVALIPGIRIPGLILQALCILAQCFILFKLSAVQYRYSTAAVCALLGAACSILANVLSGGQDAGWTLLLTIPAAILNMVGVYHTYHGHAGAIEDFDAEQAQAWEKLWKWEIGVLLATMGAVILTALSPLLGALVVLAGAIASVVVNIVSIVYLYRTAQSCRQVDSALRG